MTRPRATALTVFALVWALAVDALMLFGAAYSSGQSLVEVDGSAAVKVLAVGAGFPLLAVVLHPWKHVAVARVVIGATFTVGCMITWVGFFWLPSAIAITLAGVRQTAVAMETLTEQQRPQPHPDI